jgi:curved DNA-binding protein
MNYYEILGVNQNSSPEDIKKAYRKLASQHHPDKGGDTAKFQEIQSAYNTLSDPGQKQQYDYQLAGGGQNGVHIQWHGHDIHDIFNQFGFGDPFAAFRQQHARRNKDLRIEIPLTLESTLEEQTKTISVQTPAGERSTIEVKIPRGVNPDTNIKYPGLGDNLFNTLPRGDLYVQFAIQVPDGYRVLGVDIYHRAKVNCLLAVAGGKITVKGIDGKNFSLNVPAGTQPGLRLRIPGQGLYQLDSNNRGDLYIELEITVPQNLSEEQLNLVRSLITTETLPS